MASEDTRDSLKKPNRRQQALILALTSPPYPKIAEAARRTGIPEHTAYTWIEKNDAVRRELATIRQQQADDARIQAENVIREMVPAALSAKAKGLSAKSEHVRHLESTWILERISGKTPETHRHEGPEGGPIEHRVNLIAELDRIFTAPLPETDDNAG